LGLGRGHPYRWHHSHHPIHVGALDKSGIVHAGLSGCHAADRVTERTQVLQIQPFREGDWRVVPEFKLASWFKANCVSCARTRSHRKRGIAAPSCGGATFLTKRP
jgi:hypothetical protein